MATGRCLCGAVTYQVHGPLEPVLICTVRGKVVIRPLRLRGEMSARPGLSATAADTRGRPFLRDAGYTSTGAYAWLALSLSTQRPLMQGHRQC